MKLGLFIAGTDEVVVLFVESEGKVADSLHLGGFPVCEFTEDEWLWVLLWTAMLLVSEDIILLSLFFFYCDKRLHVDALQIDLSF